MASTSFDKFCKFRRTNLRNVILYWIKEYNWAGVYHFYAASNALCVDIEQIYLSVDVRSSSSVNKFLNNIIKCDNNNIQGMKDRNIIKINKYNIIILF